MKIASMRKIDRILGVPATFVLSLIRRINATKGRIYPEGVGKILLVKLAEQGSTVLAYPAIQRAKEMVGERNVYFLVFKQNRFILDVMEVIPAENVITISTDSAGTFFLSALAAVRRIRRLDIDAVIDMEFFARSSAILAYLSGAPIRVGFHAYAGDGPYRGSLMTHPLIYTSHLHTSQVFQILVEAVNHPEEGFPSLGLEAPPLSEIPPPAFKAGTDEMQAVRSMLCEMTGQDEVPPIILLNANCSDLLPLRRWDDDNYLALARKLLEKYKNVYIGFTGSPEEKHEVTKLVQQVNSSRCLSLAGRTTLRQLLVLYSLSRILVTNDSGPAHFATLTPIEVVTLFGPETPKLYGNLSARTHILWANTACSPCVSAYNNRLSRCRNNLCMQRITVDQVFHEVGKAFDKLHP